MPWFLDGSINADSTLIAIAKSIGIDIKLDDFQKISDSTPFLADLKPSGKYVMEDLYKNGGIPAVLLENNLIHGDALTVTGKTLSENLSNFPPLSFETQNLIHPLPNPIKPTGHIQILYGNLAPEGSMTNYWKGGYEGPKGGPGMPEIAIMGAGLGKDVVLLTDGRFSGGSHGFIIGNITPEAQVGGPIALVKDGDRITIDAEKNQFILILLMMSFWNGGSNGVHHLTGLQMVLYINILKMLNLLEGCVTDE
ncbi:dihydroxy-acid dehydratase [Gigaspora margarita]|uniref:Dihydroxy-acid dehydratase n=1 Tax=Gigaspora margarita TaxID=4874 RepID=A0A8H4AZR2_GIGMA|nr:dihydroxy-acid dehydratase [Gigaspora margarita]